MQMLRDLYAQMEWADARVWRAVLEAETAATDKTDAGGRPQNDKRLRILMLHIHTVQHAFVSVWNGQPPGFRRLASFSSPAEIADYGRAAHAALQAHLASLDMSSLDSRVVLPWAEEVLSGSAGPVTMRETLMQVVSHSTYHRGQANARLRELGGTPPLTDYIAWIWMGRPAPDWPV